MTPKPKAPRRARQNGGLLAGVLLTLTLLAAILSLSVAGLLYGGFAPVAATTADPPALVALLHGAMHRAVAREARNIDPPEDLHQAGQVLRGAYNFSAMCQACHTPPGAARSVIAQGLNPAPPPFADLAAHLTPAEAYWLISNGVRMTGMPAFGPSHDAREIWALVAFLQQAGELDANSYAALVAAARRAFAGGDGHDHDHGDGDGHGRSHAQGHDHGGGS